MQNCKNETCETVEKSKTENLPGGIIKGQSGLSYPMIFYGIISVSSNKIGNREVVMAGCKVY